MIEERNVFDRPRKKIISQHMKTLERPQLVKEIITLLVVY